jgi:hypothetical protein
MRPSPIPMRRVAAHHHPVLAAPVCDPADFTDAPPLSAEVVMLFPDAARGDAWCRAYFRKPLFLDGLTPTHVVDTVDRLLRQLRGCWEGAAPCGHAGTFEDFLAAQYDASRNDRHAMLRSDLPAQTIVPLLQRAVHGILAGQTKPAAERASTDAIP